MHRNAICVEHVTHKFGETKAVDDLSLEVPRGIIYGFLGHNGAGKTTTIRLLLGLLEPSAGKVQVLGYETRTQADEVRARTGALLEHTGLYEQLCAQDNLEFYGRAYLMPVEERQKRIKELLNYIGLWERRQEPIKKWSRGMKQKLALARVMLHHPPLVLLDEPTAGLDVAAAVEVRQNLAALVQEEGVTVFLTTHNMLEAEILCSEVGVIRQGKLVATGHPDSLRAGVGKTIVEIKARGITNQVLDQLRSRPELTQVQKTDGQLTIYIREKADSSVLVDLLVSAGVQVDEVRRGKASLEEVYLTLMEEEEQ
jgi:ABC-2 type transport system ATP-binding protein